MKTLLTGEIELIKARLDEMEGTLREQNLKPTEIFYDNEQFLELMKISSRTAQSWRTQGLISYSQVGNKTYYKHEDILDLLIDHFQPSKKKQLAIA